MASYAERKENERRRRSGMDPLGGAPLGTALTPEPGGSGIGGPDITAGKTTNRELANRYGGGDGWYEKLFAEHEGLADQTGWGSRGRESWQENIATGGLNADNQERMNLLAKGTYDQLDNQSARAKGAAPPGGGKKTQQQRMNAAGPDFSSGGNPFQKFMDKTGVTSSGPMTPSYQNPNGRSAAPPSGGKPAKSGGPK